MLGARASALAAGEFEHISLLCAHQSSYVACATPKESSSESDGDNTSSSGDDEVKKQEATGCGHVRLCPKHCITSLVLLQVQIGLSYVGPEKDKCRMQGCMLHMSRVPAWCPPGKS